MCYHRWPISPDTSTVAHQERTCFNTRAMANKLPMSYGSHDVIVMRCRKDCACHTFRSGHTAR